MLNLLVLQLLVQELLLALHDLSVLVVDNWVDLRGYMPFQVLVDVANGVMHFAHFHFWVGSWSWDEAKRCRHDHV